MLALVICAVEYAENRDTLWHYIDAVQELREEAEELILNASEDDFQFGQSGLPSRAYLEDGTLISVWDNGEDEYYVPLSSMPKAVIDAEICVEDKRFYDHNGVDYKALLRAAVELVKHKGKVTQGGSTITMQLMRTMYLTQEISWQRKVKEIFLAREFEKKFSKEQILEFYLNNIYFGNGYSGIGNAGRGYFGKNVEDLDLAQLIYLCAIPNNPTIYNPLVNSGNTKTRQERILKQMWDGGYISEEEYTAAVEEPIVLSEPETVEKNDYVDTYVTYCAVRALMERAGFSFRYDFQDEEDRQEYKERYDEFYSTCHRLLCMGGYQIDVSLDLDMQKQLQNAVDMELRDQTETDGEGVYEMQGAAVCIDNSTGFVKAIVGGRSQDFEYYTLNRAFQSFRQPGSSIKPLIVYTPLFERSYTLDTVVLDGPIENGPKNATGLYLGDVTIRHAVEESINTVAWKLFQELTPETGLSYLIKMEFSQIMEEDYGLPSALGGFTVGVSPLEMAAGYAAIENDGVFRRPTCIVRIKDTRGNILYEPDRTGERVYTQEASDIMEEALVSVLENGTGKPVKLNDTFCAGKTGTTNECKDSWFVGYTEDYTTSVWVGYDRPREIEGLSGPAYSGFIWKDFMEMQR